jgi:hypothetical protein
VNTYVPPVYAFPVFDKALEKLHVDIGTTPVYELETFEKGPLLTNFCVRLRF